MNVLDLIDTRQGTNNQYSLSNGNTLPYTTLPFGMNAFVMQSRMNDVRYFNAHDHTTYGVRLSHQPSPWMGDYAFVVFNMLHLNDEEEAKLMNEDDGQKLSEEMNKSSYQPNYATFNPHHLSYQRLRDRLKIDLVPTTYGAAIQTQNITAENNLFFSVAIAEKGKLDVSEDGSELNGYTDQLSGSKYGKFGMHFSIKASEATFEVVREMDYMEDEHAMTMYWFKFKNPVKSTLDLHFTTSYISLEQANINYQTDKQTTLSLADKKQAVASEWLTYLDKIDVNHSDMELVKTFYTSLYRTATFPQQAYELSEAGERIHYSPYTQKVESGYYYLNNGYWDTFRTNYPLYALLIPNRVPKFIEGILNIAREDKYLPKWLSPDERGLMPGTLVDAVIADAVVKDLVDKEIAKELLDAMIFSAMTESDHELEGRENTKHYFEKGYLPASTNESVNKTLDFAYSDFCIAQVAKALGEDEVADKYYESSLNYRHLFDKENMRMSPIGEDGEFVDSINDHRWGEHYTEGSSWQNSFSVFHNIADLIALFGGDEVFYEHINGLVNMEAIYESGDYGQEIHEMTEMAVLQFGQLAISNQPSFHIPYLFTYAGYPNVTQYVVKQLLTNLFDTSPEGFPGDEDNGSMSAWFVLSSLGLYAVTPGTNEYVLGINIWNDAKIHLENGKEISFESNHQEPYLNVVSKRQVDGESYEKDYITYEQLMNGAHVKQKLGVIPSVKPTALENRPFSLNKKQ